MTSRANVVVLLFCVFILQLLAIVWNYDLEIRVSPVKEGVMFDVVGWEAAKEEMFRWPKIVEASFLPASWEPTDSDVIYLQECWKDTDWLRMYSDSYCMFLWMKSLYISEVSDLEGILSVITQQERKMGEASKSNQNGGMVCKFSNLTGDFNMKAYWKPCTTEYLPANSETFKSEIVAFHIDQILGFRRTPPVIPKYFSKQRLYELGRKAIAAGDERAMYKIQTVLDKCGSPDGVEGAFVGWSNINVRPLDHKNRLLRDERVADLFKSKSFRKASTNHNFDIQQDSPIHEINWMLENSALNMFAILVGNPNKFSHSFFAQERIYAGVRVSGPILYIDNDRSNWDTDIFRRGLVKLDHPLSSICKFPLEIATRILASASFSIGDIVLESMAPYEEVSMEEPLFTKSQAQFLDQRVAFLRQIIENCIVEKGVDSVLFEEPWLYITNEATLQTEIPKTKTSKK